MTALHKFDRLEALGHMAQGGTDWREVIVQLGKSTVVLTDLQGNPVSHWSLAAISQVKTDGSATLFDLSGENTDLLWIDDAQMVAALTKIETAVQKTKPHPMRLKGLLAGGALLLGCAALATYVMSGLPVRAADATTQTTARDLGRRIVDQIDETAGPMCISPEGTTALTQIATTLSSLGDVTLHVAPTGQDHAIALPGDHIVLPVALVQTAPSAMVVAGHVIHARAAAVQNDPVQQTFQHFGAWQTVRFLVQNRTSDTALQRAMTGFMSEPVADVSTGTLLQAFDISGISATPFADTPFAINRGISDTLKEKDPYAEGSFSNIMPEGAFLGLQSICD